MSRPGRLLPILAAILVALASSLPAGAAGTRNVLHYGDSLAVGTDLYLDGYLRGWRVHSATAISRHASDAPPALRALGSSLPRVVVVSVGTNDDPGRVAGFARIVHETVSLVGPSRCVVWSTIARPPYQGVSYAAFNRVLRAAARRHANLRVLDWAAMADAHPAWFGRDGVHPTTAGYRARASATARLVERCGR